MNKIIFATAAVFAVGNAIKLRHDEEVHPCEELSHTTAANFEETYEKAKVMVEAEIKKVADTFDMEVLDAELGVRMGDMKALKEAVTNEDGTINTDELVKGCHHVDAHFKALRDGRIEHTHSQCDALAHTTAENFDETYEKVKVIVEAEIKKVGDKFDEEVLDEELGVRMGDKEALKEAVTNEDGTINTDELVKGCYKVEEHFAVLHENNANQHPCEELNNVTNDNFDESYEKATAMVEAEIATLGEKFNMDTLTEEMGVDMGDKKALKEMVTSADGTIDTEMLK